MSKKGPHLISTIQLRNVHASALARELHKRRADDLSLCTRGIPRAPCMNFCRCASWERGRAGQHRHH